MQFNSEKVHEKSLLKRIQQAFIIGNLVTEQFKYKITPQRYL